MPNGFDPVWMETVRIEIARDRLRLHQRGHLQEGQKGSSTDDDGGGVGDDDVPPTDFSIIVWNNCGQGQGQSKQAKVGWLVGYFQYF